MAASRRALLQAPAAPILLATGYLVIPAVPLGPLWIGASRVLLGGAVLLYGAPGLPRGHWRWRLPTAGTLNFSAPFALQALAVTRLSASVAAVLVATTTLINTALAVRRHQERRLAMAIAVVAVAGLAAAVDLTDGLTHGHLDLLGLAAGLGAAACLAAGKELSTHWGAPPVQGARGHLNTTAWQLLGSGVLLLPLATMFEDVPLPTLSAGQWWLLAWLSIGATAAAYGIQIGGLVQGVPTNVVSRLGLLCPVVAAIATWWLQGHQPTAAQITGAAVAVAAVAVGLIIRKPGPLRLANRMIMAIGRPAIRRPMRSSPRDHTINTHGVAVRADTDDGSVQLRSRRLPTRRVVRPGVAGNCVR
jgi:probable blue pigment (indigoidine) exporter